MSNGKLIMIILFGIFIVLLFSKVAGLLIEYHFQSKSLEIERKSKEEQNKIFAEYTMQIYELTASVLREEQ